MNNKKLTPNFDVLFNTSIALFISALTIVSLIQIKKESLLFFIDEFFVVEAFLFLIIAFFSYLKLNGVQIKKENLINVIFIFSMLGMLLGSVLLTFTI